MDGQFKRQTPLEALCAPTYGVSHYFGIELGRTQYLAWYFLVDWLAYLMPLETAARVVFSLYAVGLPLSLAALLRAHGRDPRVALLAAPFVYSGKSNP